jgi:hypothetical protein
MNETWARSDSLGWGITIATKSCGYNAHADRKWRLNAAFRDGLACF